ncbi:MAG: DNA polymerase Y family protein [Proteobacteria bacterium]|nr:DNA polymerase Y family protein [Pseudomonadota bacterium]
MSSPKPLQLDLPVPAAAPAQPRVPEPAAPRVARVLPAPPPAVDAQAQPARLWAGLSLPGIQGSGQLEKLAEFALRLSPQVSPEPPDGLLLEVGGSLRLFAGIAGLRAALLEACAARQVTVQLAFAPTPLAALVMARAGRSLAVTDRAQLGSVLGPLPLQTLRWPPEALGRLRRMGVRTVGAALRLPRAGFARRFGPGALAQLDELTGRAPALRHWHRARAHYRRRHELSCELTSHASLLAELGRMLEELERFLELRQAGLMQLQCRLLHRKSPASGCVLHLAAPAAAAAHLERLFAEQFARLMLPEPVRALELEAGPLLPRDAQAQALWQPGEHGGRVSGEAHRLIERLRARLGEESIQGLKLLDDHRPESTWIGAEPPALPARAASPAPPPVPGAPRRPLWLLDPPQPLAIRAGLPQHHGRLELLGEPERIETGWWDGEVVRDYYAARDPRGVRLWVFRERLPPHGWFLHGIFG